jgi:hypothetical protein
MVKFVVFWDVMPGFSETLIHFYQTPRRTAIFIVTNVRTGACKISQCHYYQPYVLIQHAVVGVKNMPFTVAEYYVLV